MLTNLIAPKILIISPSLDLQFSAGRDDIIYFDNLKHKEHKFLKKIKENLKKLDPNIIFVEKFCNGFVSEYL